MEVHALYVFWGCSGSTENLVSLSIMFRASRFPGGEARPVESVLPRHKTLLVQQTAWEDCCLLFTPGSFRGWFWVTAPLPKGLARMCRLFSPVAVRGSQDGFRHGWGTALPEAAIQWVRPSLCRTALIWNGRIYYYDSFSPSNIIIHVSYEMNLI